MINSKSKKKCISYSEIGDPRGSPIIIREEMEILLSNSDGDGEGTGTYAKYRGWVRGDWSPPLPSPLPSLNLLVILKIFFKFFNFFLIIKKFGFVTLNINFFVFIFDILRMSPSPSHLRQNYLRESSSPLRIITGDL